ncbi:hypothetical protein Tco_1319219 [Tanacetum coccineum]
MAIPNEEGDGYTKEVIRVKYEWKAPHCGECKIFGHDLLQCPKHVTKTVFNDPSTTKHVGTSTTMDTSSDGFTEVTRKKNKGTKADQQSRSRHIDGIRLNKPKPNFYWQKKGTNKSGADLATKGQMGDDCGISSSTASEHTPSTWNEDFESDDEVDEVIFPEGNKWIHTYKLKGRSFWDIPIKSNLSWGWLKLLQIRDLVKPFFWTTIGNGKNTFVWFDNWCTWSPLIWYLTPRDISSKGFNMKNCVANLVANGGWLWPQAWLLKAPNLGLIPVLTLIDSWTDLV